MVHFEKWIEGLDPRQDVFEAARSSVTARLAAIQFFLPLAAEQADEDVEYVHELRVFTRRATAAFRLYAKLLPKREVKWFAKQLRKLRRAAGEARDLDVLTQRHLPESHDGPDDFRDALLRRRQAAQSPIAKLYRKLGRSGRLDRHVQTIADCRPRRVADVPFGQWAVKKLRRSFRRFRKAWPSDHCDLSVLHQFRIRAKQLRYTIELLASAFPPELREEIYPVVEGLQDQLGEIHDHAVAQDKLRKWIDDARSEQEAERARAILAKERAELAVAIESFDMWWTPEAASKLEARVKRLLAAAPAATSNDRCSQRAKIGLASP